MKLSQIGDLKHSVASRTSAIANHYLPPSAATAAAASSEKASHAYLYIKDKFHRGWASYNRYYYHSLPGAPGGAGKPGFCSRLKGSTWFQRARPIFLIVMMGAFLVLVRTGSQPKEQSFTGYWNGVGTLVSMRDYVPEQSPNFTSKLPYNGKAWTEPPFDPVPVNPFPDFNSSEYLADHHEVLPCYLDDNETILRPEIYAYPGLPQNMTLNTMGSFKALGLPDGICYERFGRWAPYGYGYPPREGGMGLTDRSERAGSERVYEMSGKIDYRGINWAAAQERCYAKNSKRFETPAPGSNKQRVKRHAFVLRAWTGYDWNDYQIMTIRAIITELSLQSGGEYDVYILMHVKDPSIPIWTDKAVYQRVVDENVPKEFRDITVLWSDRLMEMYYPGPFPDNRENDSGHPIHSVYRSSHFPIQWFSQERPHYDFYWNWEMDVRLTGHYYQFNDIVGSWAKKQPRKGMWERSAKYYIPGKHGSWDSFRNQVEDEIKRSGENPVWGPQTFPHNGMLPSPSDCFPPRSYDEDNYEWGVGEDADLIAFNPLFDPGKTKWVFKHDITGYPLDVPPPPRRVAIIAIGRLSKRLLDTMHREVYKMHHTMFTEMFPPTVALHHGMKALTVPHPMFFDRPWDLNKMDQVFNYPKTPKASVFAGGEPNQLRGSFYYHAVFAGQLWRRWLGFRENGAGGSLAEVGGTGRMCLQTMLLHPIKYESGQTD